MKTIGFPISRKASEKRRAILPPDIEKYVIHKNCIYVEQGYGLVMNFSDEDYLKLGCHVVSRDEVLMQDIICDPKIGDAEYLDRLNDQTLFGWIHAVQNRDICDKIVGGENSAYAWEDMFKDNIHSFYRNNQLAGEAAVLHAFLNHGSLPLHKEVGIIGNGNTSRGAQNILVPLSANVRIYNREDEQQFKNDMGLFDVIVNCILWDTNRHDHIIYREDLKRLKKDCLIIDISCDHNGAIESSHPTKLTDPTYVVEGITHYAVDHTPTLVYKEATRSISLVVAQYVDNLVSDLEDEVLTKAKIVDKGNILDQRIKDYQNR